MRNKFLSYKTLSDIILIESLQQIITTTQNYKKKFYIIDRIVNTKFKLHKLITTHNKITINSKENIKTLKTFTKIINAMLEKDICKTATLIAIGGGVIGDLSGLIAKCYYRGIKLINIPTTLIAQIDSAIGGKNGVNSNQGKNLIGSFKQANQILIYTPFLTQLSNYNLTCGLSEAIKIAIINNKVLFKFIQQNLILIINKQINSLKTVLKHAITSKCKLILHDTHETHTQRIKLNLGHTYAHAIEKYLNYSINHGEAVLMGLILATRISQYYTHYDLQAITTLIQATKPYIGNKLLRINKKLLIKNICYDKKKIDNNQITIIIIKKIGKVKNITIKITQLSKLVNMV
ncbi:3-dehydroquinate synthase [Candidatus Vidania fulgoroideae]|uniref:3-dehydroquinate synthase n=1 Tax=Candidatus Vidania fulgoroideorum TaxID=881286 RepID=A0A974X7E3_9PROT|nr:3-dehydroquinate synthase [Candidatus Vidania fulgoroideae]